MKKLIILTLFVLSFGIIQAQDAEFKAELKTFMKNGNTSGYGKEKFQELFMQLFQAAGDALPYKTPQEQQNAAVELGTKYYETQAIDDLCDIFAPYYAKHLTIDELRIINKTLAEEKNRNVWDKASNDKVNMAIAQVFMTVVPSTVNSIMQGAEPEALLDATEKESSYYKTVENLNSVSGVSEIFSNSLDAATASLTDPAQKEFMGKVFAHINKILPEIVYKTYKEVLNEEELNTLLALYERPEFKKMTNANKEMFSSQNIMVTGMEVMKKVAAWLDTQDIIKQ